MTEDVPAVLGEFIPRYLKTILFLKLLGA